MKRVAPVVDRMIVVGAPNSSNSQRLREVAERAGCPKAVLIQRASEIDWTDFEGVARIGVTAGASAPEVIVEEVLDAFAARYRHLRRARAHRRGEHRVQPAAVSSATQRPDGLIAAWRSTPRSAMPTSKRSCSAYDLGALLSFKGIAEGVENSNFLLRTEAGNFILTLYEKRVAEADLPFFLGLMEHLAERGISCPLPVKGRDGKALRRIAGRPAAIISFLEGIWVRRPQTHHCAAVGQALAEMHRPGRIFRCRAPTPCRCDGWRPLFEMSRSARRRGGAGARRRSSPSELAVSGIGLARRACPTASSTPTSFPTTCSS